MIRMLLLVLVTLGLVACKEAAPTDTNAAKTTSVKTEPMKAPEGAASQPVPTSFAEKPAVGTEARCAVSGEAFTVDEDTVVAEHDGRHFPFCCPSCQDEFAANPAKFAAKTK